MRHAHSMADIVERPICELAVTVAAIGSATRKIYQNVDCPDCLRRLIAETEARACVLSDLHVMAEGAS